MVNKDWDVVVLTDARYIGENYNDEYSRNVILEDQLVVEALKRKGLRVFRTNWDNSKFDWSTTNYILFRTTWDYFDRYDEFEPWLGKVSQLTNLINPADLIKWNIDKFYLQDLNDKGIAIPPSIFIEKGCTKSLSEIVKESDWCEFILKPAISGAARHTYRFKKDQISPEAIEAFNSLNPKERFLLQEYQTKITSKGEVAFMVFGGEFSHAILKKAKSGDFRVQDDFGGTVHHYQASAKEIEFVEKTVAMIEPTPIYARVDVMWDNNNNLCLGELEMIEPELWFRYQPFSADRLAETISSLFD